MKLKNARKVGLLSIGLPYFDTGTAEDHLQQTREFLKSRWEVYGPDNVITELESLEIAIERILRQNPVDLLVLQLGTFPDGEFPMILAERLKLPIILHSLPEPDLEHNVDLNSLCGANLATYSLTAIEHPHSFVHGDPNDPGLQEELAAHIHAGLSLATLSQTRIGLLGFRAPGFYPCVFDELLLRRKFGTAVDYIDLGQVREAFNRGHRKEAPAKRFPRIEGGELPEESVALMERYYAALTDVFETSGKSVFAVKDWPELLDVNAPGSIWPALGWLMDDGYLLAPEGDVNAAVTMALCTILSGNLPFFSDISAWDDELSAFLLWHYGGAPSLAKSPSEIRYGKEGREVQFTLKPGTATLVRLGMYANRFRILAVATRVLEKPVSMRRAGAWLLTIETPARDVMNRILDQGWEHHFCLVHGNILPELKVFSKLTGIPLEVL